MDIVKILFLCAAAIGIKHIFHKFLQLFSSCIQEFLNSFISCVTCRKKQSLSEKYGKWAVITGSTDGIGKQFAFELAKRGMNIFLLARSEEKLTRTKKEIEEMSSVAVSFIVVDFSNGKEIYERIKSRVSMLDVGMLVNNVGIFHESPSKLYEISEDVVWNMVNVNVGAVTMMSRLIIPQMKANKRGLIVNVSSGTELQPTPLFAVYAATKCFNRNFTLALRRELSSHNINVQLLSPMHVDTSMVSFMPSSLKGNFITPNVETYVKSAVSKLGKCSHTTGYWSHGIQYSLLLLLPEYIRTEFSYFSYRLIRKHYLKRREISNV